MHEIKFDGYRMQLRVAGGKAKLFTRKGLDWTAKFPEIAEEGSGLPDCIIDGEICAVDDKGVSDFGLLQNALSEQKTGGLVFYVFDCLYAAGYVLKDQPLRARKLALQAVLKGARVRRIHFVSHFSVESGDLLEAACRLDLEGIISKRLDGRYISGRNGDWTKAKCRGGQEVVIGAWRGSDSKLRSLLVGSHKDGKLVYMGRVGTGYTAATAHALLKQLKPLRSKTPTFPNAPRDADINWVKPKLVAEIEYENVTSDGIFRQAAFKGLRMDKDAGSIVPEVAGNATPREKRAMVTVTPKAKSSAKADATVLGITISHPDKVLWPKSKVGPAQTKLDLAKYMAAAAPRMLPHIAGRPVSVVRAPDGVDGEKFFQRHEMKGTAAPMLAIKVRGEPKPYLGVATAEALVALAQQAGIEIHPWGSKPGDPDIPERIIFDLDPAPDVPFARVIAGALDLRKRLTKLGLVPFVKTTGGKGLHVVVAVKGSGGRELSWPDVKAFARAVAEQMADQEPDLYTATMAKKARTGKIFVDYLRNDRTSTGVAPWSPRAREGATVAVPLKWSDLKTGLNPAKFTIATVGPLLKKADPWKDLAASAKPLAAAVAKLGVG